MQTLAAETQNVTVAPSSPLSLVLSRMRSIGSAAIFDLDSTLLDNRPRQATIVREFGAHVGEAAFERVQAEDFEGWDLSAAARNAGVPSDVVERHAADLRRFWRERFFTSAYCRFDVAVPGAPEFVSEVSKLGRVIYLTGRPPEMRPGTEESLVRLGFPKPGVGRTTLLLKPDPDMHDDVWKVAAVELANGLGPVVAAFDNEPTHINGYRLAWPSALCVRLATDHSGRPVQLSAGILEVSSFVR
jgi:phosphoglycolate phosphatase-like HAD superfamily hydrolase